MHRQDRTGKRQSQDLQWKGILRPCHDNHAPLTRQSDCNTQANPMRGRGNNLNMKRASQRHALTWTRQGRAWQDANKTMAGRCQGMSGSMTGTCKGRHGETEPCTEGEFAWHDRTKASTARRGQSRTRRMTAKGRRGADMQDQGARTKLAHAQEHQHMTWHDRAMGMTGQGRETTRQRGAPCYAHAMTGQARATDRTRQWQYHDHDNTRPGHDNSQGHMTTQWHNMIGRARKWDHGALNHTQRKDRDCQAKTNAGKANANRTMTMHPEKEHVMIRQ